MVEPGQRPARLVACLCADWCHICQDFRAVFDALAQQFAADAQFVWVDIEDDEEALGGVEVDDFPTLLIAHDDSVAFFGVVQAAARSVQDLMLRAREGHLARVHDARLDGLPARLRALR